MQMNREIKDSGIKWVGKVPGNWKIHRFKNILQNRNLKNKPKVTDTILSLTKDRGVIPYSEKGDIGNRSKEDITKYNLAFPEDIVMNSMNVIIGSVNISKYTGAVSPVYYVFYPKNKNTDIYFYNMLFQTREFQNSLKGIGNGILEHRMRIPLNKLNNIRLPLPEYKEQLKIVDFLDKAIINVNNIITQTYQSIEELKKYKQSLIIEAVTKGLDSTVEMKDSGVEWIGAIPSRWGLNQIKTVAKVMNGKEIENDGGHIPVFGSGGVFKYTDTKLYDRESVLFGRKGTIGKPLIVNQPFWTVDTMFYTHIFENRAFPKWLYYILISLPWDVYSTQTAIPSIVGSEIESIRIPVPAIEEQQQIVEYLDDKVTTIDRLIEDKTKVIEELENYKKSLIYEYVTGKKEV
ncbi:restriction endonuclease subunit S [Staphylococcus epidermidis]|uniref:restriction endonuclease subunit S n=2 Tax=Staphylococcus epidermidis TaxID=1282 RepID=UPI0018892035|nr:restriction endonuclease subunit S [Staphylococcus epidermidis]MBF2297079.1 restriction endonuclease subunit S [Staphylococcus epidermidis]MBF2306256.1 restriction endonuclease subunit S [Staphylococcus epidermidis]MBF2315267.1 restriction endonuclease subunit S [Staphylococcus epidermidis]MBM0803419.1 restriction endonuclease subunit S [Staphylococcus epidermidis]